jgi:hypothetical protein
MKLPPALRLLRGLWGSRRQGRLAHRQSQLLHRLHDRGTALRVLIDARVNALLPVGSCQALRFQRHGHLAQQHAKGEDVGAGAGRIRILPIGTISARGAPIAFAGKSQQRDARLRADVANKDARAGQAAVRASGCMDHCQFVSNPRRNAENGIVIEVRRADACR